MTEERKLALYCLKANSNYHSEVCEECINYPNCDHTIQDDVTEIIIKALEQEPCGDAISRQAAIDCVTYDEEYTVECLKALPPVSTEKTGRWISWYEVIESADGKSEDHIPHCKCSECNCEYDTYSARFIKYCPNCGAKMEVEE